MQEKPYDEGYEAGQIAQRVLALEQSHGRLQANQDKLIVKLDELIPAVAELRVKAGVWGGVGGILAIVVTLGIAVAMKLM